MSPNNSPLSLRFGYDPNAIVTFKKGFLSLARNIKALKKYCAHNQVDIIHGHDSHAHTLLWAAYRFGGLNTKSVVTRRLMNPIKSRSINKYNYPKIEKIICISEAVKKIIEPSITDQSRLDVIHSSIPYSSKKVLIDQNQQSDNFVIGYVAAFTKEKDHETFLKTAKYLLTNYPEMSYQFLLVGDGPLLDKIKSASTDISNHIHFSGFVKNVDVEYSKMDLLLHTSNSEALGTSILDAMTFNLPIVATNVGGIPEIVNPGQNGYLCQIGDYKTMGEQIHEIAKNKKLYHHLSSHNSKILANFDVSAMVQKTLDLYSEVFD